jgi:hypothetical protein
LVTQTEGLFSPTAKMIRLKKEMTHSRSGQVLYPSYVSGNFLIGVKRVNVVICIWLLSINESY